MRSFLSIIIALTFCLPISACCANVTKGPVGWNAPSSKQSAQAWRVEDSNRYLAVKGDFNGDGHPDEAKILLNEDEKLIGLFVFLSNIQGGYEIIELDKKAYNYIDVMGIELFEKGVYRERGEKTFHEGDIPFENDSIKYFKFDGAYGVYRWNTVSGKFEFVGLND
jgi:hypothetical protein